MKTIFQKELRSHKSSSEKNSFPEKKKKWQIVLSIFLSCVMLISALGLGFFLGYLRPHYEKQPLPLPQTEEMDYGVPNWIQEAVIDIDGVSRSGEKLSGVTDIVVHYVGNPGSTAKGNRDYFDGPESQVSSHFVVGLEGEVLLCVPLDEKSAATNHRNIDTISIEVCHPDETGEFTFETRVSLVRLLSYLLDRFDLDTENIIRHYDVTGKHCPLYYVTNPDAFVSLKQEVAAYLEKAGI